MSNRNFDPKSDDGTPWFRQVWFTKIVAPIIVSGVIGFGSMFFLLRSDLQKVRAKAESAKTRSSQNAAKIEAIRKNRQNFEKRVVESLGRIEANQSNMRKELKRMRNQ